MVKRRFSAADADAALTDEMRCRRSDGRKWRCRRRVMSGVAFCEYHYHSIKSRTELRRPKRRSEMKKKTEMPSDPDSDELVRMAIKRQMERREKRVEKESEVEKRMELPNGVMAISSAPVRVLTNAGDVVDRKIGLGLDDGVPMRRCVRSKNVEPVPIGPVKKLPRGLGSSRKRICQGCSETSCQTCMERGNLDNGSKMLPAEQLNWEQMSELQKEAKNQGRKLSGLQLEVAEYGHDEHLECNHCGVSVGSFHRSCSKCSYKLCLSCCREFRQGSLSLEGGIKVSEKSELQSLVAAEQRDKNRDDNISCPSSEHGGCGDGILNMKFLLLHDPLQSSSKLSE